jgi:beta-glucosidase
MAVAFVRGLQGDDPHYLKVIATPKHFVANNEEFDRFKANAEISERTLREYYLPAFRAAVVEGKAQSVMTSYNAVNGVPSSANHWLLTDVLRKEWGFNGYVVTDCGAISHLFDAHKFTQNPEEAAALAINAGVDMECGSWSDTPYVYKNYLLKALKDGLVTTETINHAVSDILRVRFRLGLFDPPGLVSFSKIPGNVIGSPEHIALARQAARESMVLLKNESKLLPIDPSKFHSIAIMGPGADVAEFGAYSGHTTDPVITPFDGLRTRAGGAIHVNLIPWIQGNIDGTPVPIPQAQTAPPNAGVDEHGLRGEYFDNPNLAGTPSIRTDLGIDFDWVNMPPDPMLTGAPYSIRWTGDLNPAFTGEYKLTLICDDGVRLSIGDKLLVDSWDAKPTATLPPDYVWTPVVPHKTYNVSLSFVAGHSYPIVLEYRNQGGSLEFRYQTGSYIQLNWLPPTVQLPELFVREREAAKKNNLVIAVLEPGAADGAEGRDRKDLDLPLDQQSFIREIYAANPNTIVVLVNGGPLAIQWIKDHIPAIVEAWYPGEQGGNALADVLFGDFDPAGRLPLTFYQSIDQLPPFNDYEISHGRTYMYLMSKPLYPFGYGLSYTHFRYSNLHFDRRYLSATGTLRTSVDITNDGDKDGAEVVQLYSRLPHSQFKGPIRELRAFQRITVPQGKTRTVVLTSPVLSFGHYDTSIHRFVVDPGPIEIQVGASSSDIRLHGTITIRQSAATR